MRQFLLFILLIFCQFIHQSIGSCCCCDCCCCCCPCCCCCCGSSNVANTDLALGGAQTPPPDDDLTLGAQTARQNTAGLGPGLLPDGSTGRTNQQQNNPFNDQFGRKKRRKRGLGILENNNSTKTTTMEECGIKCAPILCFGRLLAKRMAVAMPYGSTKPKQKPILPSDWTMSIAPENEPSLGPGLLPDGSTGRRPTTSMNGDHHFGDIFGNNGMNWQRRRRRRRSNEGIAFENYCDCKCVAQTKEKRESFQLGFVPLDEMQHKNQTYLRLLLGLVPEEGNKKAKNQMKMMKRGTELNGDGGEFTIRRQFFLVPVDSKIKKKERKPAEENVQSVLPKPPLQFYKAIVPNPENDQDRYEPDYD